MLALTVDDIRDVLHVNASDIPDDKALKMIKRAVVTLSLELTENIDYLDCSEAQKEAITLLAAIYAVCYLTGGSTIGLNFSVGDLTSNNSAVPSLNVLQTEFERVLDSLKTPYVGERLAMGNVPEAYYQFVMDYAPNVYVIASFAIDFLCEAYSTEQFEDRKADIYAKIVSIADWVLTQQCLEPARKGYGGFKSSETKQAYPLCRKPR